MSIHKTRLKMKTIGWLRGQSLQMKTVCSSSPRLDINDFLFVKSLNNNSFSLPLADFFQATLLVLFEEHLVVKMANTLFDHGTEYNFYKTNFTENHATMRRTKPDNQKPSKLELLQEDYRSRLLREREQKANALFEQRVRAELLPKKGSVREFFLNRRMLAAEACNAAVDLPPISSNTRYKGKYKFIFWNRNIAVDINCLQIHIIIRQ